MKCKRCGGLKYIGEEYHALDRYWVDVTCLQCAHSKDIETTKLYDLLVKLKKAQESVNQQDNS